MGTEGCAGESRKCVRRSASTSGRPQAPMVLQGLGTTRRDAATARTPSTPRVECAASTVHRGDGSDGRATWDPRVGGMVFGRLGSMGHGPWARVPSLARVRGSLFGWRKRREESREGVDARGV
uniref:Uncharacterized protein n=1 Tax=Oryza glumipatula TaxID=40148 RepID=A0A0D9Y6P4_9ORYZ